MNSCRKIGVKTSSVSTKFFSLKMNRIVLTESLLEMNYCYLWELCPKILWYQEQSLTFKISKFKYTPDFELNTKNFKILIEVKHSKRINKVLHKLKFVQDYFLSGTDSYYPKVILFTDCDLNRKTTAKLREIYFNLLNKNVSLLSGSSCPFGGSYYPCPLKRNLNIC